MLHLSAVVEKQTNRKNYDLDSHTASPVGGCIFSRLVHKKYQGTEDDGLMEGGHDENLNFLLPIIKIHLVSKMKDICTC